MLLLCLAIELSATKPSGVSARQMCCRSDNNESFVFWIIQILLTLIYNANKNQLSGS